LPRQIPDTGAAVAVSMGGLGKQMNAQAYHKRQDTYLGPEAQRSELFMTVLDLLNRYGGLAIIETLNFITDLQVESISV
jgi:hypothetical protein